MATITTQEIVRQQAPQFTTWLLAFKECGEDIQQIVLEMSNIVRDRNSTPDEIDHATDVIVEALFPGIVADAEAVHKDFRGEKAYLEAREELLDQEQFFADKIRELMVKNNLTQEELANKTGVSQPAISNILNRCCRPQQRTITRFAEVFEVPPESLWPAFEPSSNDS